MEVYILYKRVWSDQETGSRNKGGGATSSEAAQEYFGAKWRLAYCYKERSMDPRISCVILCSQIMSSKFPKFKRVQISAKQFW
jgi:hypothetical protein